jgi:microcystin-dependent protein
VEPFFKPRSIGQKSGQETTSLTHSQLPTHTHTAVFTPSGGGSADVQVSQTQGTKATPDAGDFLGAGPAFGAAEPNYVPSGSQGTTVSLGGVSGGGGGGTVTVDTSGASASFWLLQPFQVINWSICLIGLYPPRN